MTPAYWPKDLALVRVRIYDSALKHGVGREAILEVLSLPRHRLEHIDFGQRHKLDLLYGSRTTISMAFTIERDLLEIGIRLDRRRAQQHCIVFHAVYL